MNIRTVVITDGDQRAALAVVRSLGAKGFRCVVTTHRGRSIAGASRFAAAERRVPDPLADPAAFAAAIAGIVSSERAALLIPIAEPAALALLPRRELFVGCAIPFPSADAFAAITDKQRLLADAQREGIAVPAQTVVATPADVAGLAIDQLPFPIVIKPARSVGQAGESREKLTVSYAANAAELRARLARLPETAYPVLLQERVIGPGTGVFVLLWNGELRASFAHRRLCEKPPSGGASVYCESVAMDADLLRKSCALLSRFGWQGVAMAEFKRSTATGKAYLMEVNARFWGSLQLAIDAGVDFPALLAACALGDPVPPPPTYRIGVRCRWFWGQVDHLISRVRRSSSVPPDAPSVASVATDLLFGPLRRDDHNEMFRLHDVRPFLRETLRWWTAR